MGGGSPDGETGGSVAACEGKAVAAPGRGTRPAVTGLRSLLPSDPGGFDSRTRSPRSASLDVLMGEGSRPSHGLGSTRGPTFLLISRRIDTLVVAFISPLGIAARRPSSPRPLHRGLCTVPFHHRQPFRFHPATQPNTISPQQLVGLLESHGRHFFQQQPSPSPICHHPKPQPTYRQRAGITGAPFFTEPLERWAVSWGFAVSRGFEPTVRRC